MTKLFLPHATLEEWTLSDRADIQGDHLTIAGESATYPVVEAVHVTQLVSGTDTQKLLQKVKTTAQLAELGAEHMQTSVLLGDDAYEAVPGYTVEVPEEVVAPAASAPAALPAAGPAAKNPARPGKETDLLAAFLLDKL